MHGNMPMQSDFVFLPPVGFGFLKLWVDIFIPIPDTWHGT